MSVNGRASCWNVLSTETIAKFYIIFNKNKYCFDILMSCRFLKKLLLCCCVIRNDITTKRTNRLDTFDF